MWIYIARRLFQGLLTMLIATLIIFTITNLAPGDPIIFIVGGGEAPPPELVAKLRAEYGLDKSIYERLIIYIFKILSGDLGYSYVYRESVAELILSRLPATIILAVSTYILTTILGIVVAMKSVRNPFSRLDRIINILSTILFSFPSFYIAQLFLLLLAMRLSLLPTSGFIDPRTPGDPISITIDIARHSILPVLSLSIVILGFMIRVSRTAILDALREDFIMTLRAVGMSEGRVIKSAVRVALTPILTLANYEVAFLLSGALLVEMVYSWPGIGTLLYDAILKRDYPLVSGIFFTIIGFSVLINLITDLAYLLIDPRIRLGKGAET